MTGYVLGRGRDLTFVRAGDTDPYVAWCAMLAVCGRATSEHDARELLDALGLIPAPRRGKNVPSPASPCAENQIAVRQLETGAAGLGASSGRAVPGTHRKRAKAR